MKSIQNLGMFLLPIWLIVYGVFTMPMLKLGSEGMYNIIAVFAIVVGALILARR